MLGRYELFDEIATGGMASVHVGRLVGLGGLGRTVAVKRALPAFARDRDFVERFLDEAHLAMRVRHPNVVPTLDVVAADGELFIVMEYVHGESMESILRRGRELGERMPIPVAVHVAAGVLHGLHAAHEATNERGAPLGIVHRDVSPQNVILAVDGVPRIFDFGVAKAIGTLHTTREGRLEGKLAYMAPEQLERRDLDRRADVYAASVVLWEALTGRKLHDGTDEVDVFVQVARGHVEPPHLIHDDISEALSAAVMRGLAREPEDRFETALDMAIALEDLRLSSTAREAGDWAKRRGGDKLTVRKRLIDAVDELSALDSMTMRAAIESLAPRSTPVPGEAMPAPPRVPSDMAQLASNRAGADDGAVAGRSKVGPHPPIWLLVLAALAVVVLAALVGLRR